MTTAREHATSAASDAEVALGSAKLARQAAETTADASLEAQHAALIATLPAAAYES